MAKVCYRKIKKTFQIEYGSGNFADFKEGKYVMAIPECDTETHRMICYEHSPFRMPNNYLFDEVYNSINDIPDFKYSNLI